MKKMIIPVLCALALTLGSCKKEDNAPSEEEPANNNTNNNPNNNPPNPSATSNNGIVIASMQFGNSPSAGKMIRIDLDTKATTDLPIPMMTDDYFDVSPNGKTLVYMRQYTDTLIYLYSLETGAKTALLLKNGSFNFPAGVHYNADGSKVLFVNSGKIYSLDAGGSASQTPTEVSTINTSDAGGTPLTWTADGTKLIANGFSGNTNTAAHNLCYIDVATGKATRVSNGIDVTGQGYGKEITQAQNTKAPTFNGAVIAQNGYWGNLTYGYRGWTMDGNIYYYSNKECYQESGQSPAGVNTGVLFKLNAPSKTEDSPAYTGMRLVQISSDGKKYAAITAALNGKMKIFNSADNSEAVDLSSLENAAQRFAGIRFANK